MESNDKMYRYAAKEEQLRRANRFALIGYILFYAIALVTMWIACSMGKQTMQMSLAITAVVIVSCILNFVTYVRNSMGMLTRYTALAGLLITAMLTARRLIIIISALWPVCRWSPASCFLTRDFQ